MDQVILFVQQLLNGLSLGSIYALIALGYTMVYGVLRFINFAHGDVFMVGAFVGYYAAPRILPLVGGSLLLAGPITLLLSMLVCSTLGVTIEKLAYRPLRPRPKLTILITAIGISLFLEFGGQLIFGPDPKSFPTLLPSAVLIDTPNLVLRSTPVIVIGTAARPRRLLPFILRET